MIVTNTFSGSFIVEGDNILEKLSVNTDPTNFGQSGWIDREFISVIPRTS